jgi:hypothetical protein
LKPAIHIPEAVFWPVDAILGQSFLSEDFDRSGSKASEIPFPVEKFYLYLDDYKILTIE